MIVHGMAMITVVKRLTLGSLPLVLLAACAGNQEMSLDSLFGTKVAISVPAHAVADIGVTRCDQLATAEWDPDRVTGVVPVKWLDLKAPAAITACEQGLRENPGHRRLQALLARAYQKQYRYDDAFEVATLAASTGSLEALNRLGLVYQDGKHDKEQAIKHFESAAKAGHVGAMVSLGRLLSERDGWGDKRKAMSWQKSAASQGNVTALVEHGVMYIVHDKDFVKAFPLFQLAAKQGNADSQHMMGLYYARGIAPVELDPDQAMRYFEQAAKNGFGGAGVQAARLYLRSRYSDGLDSPILETDRNKKALYWLGYGMPKLSVR